jgi:hypothetical protein
VTAGALELLTMLPYLAAVGLLASAGLSPLWYLPLLVGYCVVMVLPALVLVGLRVAAHDRLEGPLRRLDNFLSRHADSAIGWVIRGREFGASASPETIGSKLLRQRELLASAGRGQERPGGSPAPASRRPCGSS